MTTNIKLFGDPYGETRLKLCPEHKKELAPAINPLIMRKFIESSLFQEIKPEIYSALGVQEDTHVNIFFTAKKITLSKGERSYTLNLQENLEAEQISLEILERADEIWQRCLAHRSRDRGTDTDQQQIFPSFAPPASVDVPAALIPPSAFIPSGPQQDFGDANRKMYSAVSGISEGISRLFANTAPAPRQKRHATPADISKKPFIPTGESKHRRKKLKKRKLDSSLLPDPIPL